MPLAIEQMPSPSGEQAQPWTIQAKLDEAVSSANTKPGQTIQATAIAPIFNRDHTVAVPQGATLVGSVTQVKASRKFGRSAPFALSSTRSSFHLVRKKSLAPISPEQILLA
jgi:hypothetical protein